MPNANYALTEMICKALGIDMGTISSLKYEQSAGELGYVTVVMPIRGIDDAVVAQAEQRFVLAPIELEPKTTHVEPYVPDESKPLTFKNPPRPRQE